MSYCEKNNMEVFDIIPMTILVQYDSPGFSSQFDKFKDLFSSLTEYCRDGSQIENLKFYSCMFKLGIHNEKLGNKSKIFIPKTHFDGRNMWLIKATDLNRGRCIKIADNLEEIKSTIKKFYDGIFRDFKKGQNEPQNEIKEELNKKQNKKFLIDYRKYRTSCMLLQKYIEKPLLYKGRKFDIRIWVLYSHKDMVFIFREGHLKTSSYQYDILLKDSYVHLTNYSVQKYSKEFSKYEYGNEVSFSEFQIFLNTLFDNKISIYESIFPKITNLVKITFLSVKDKINMNKRKHCFEIFGFDFIIDKDLNVNILEVNTNPGLEESSPLIRSIVPRMIDDALRLTIDDAFYESEKPMNNSEYLSPFPLDGYTASENLWSLVVDLKLN